VFVERLWRSVKYEEVYLRAYESVFEARTSIGRYLDFYNGRRPHSSLDGTTPDQAYFTRCHSAWQPNPGRGSTYRRGKSVQTTGTTSSHRFRWLVYPRHRHNFDQLRYIIKGTYPYAKGKVMPEGWVGYFPESVHYGPQERPEGLEMLTCQFGGASGSGYLSVAQREAANDRLKKRANSRMALLPIMTSKGSATTRTVLRLALKRQRDGS